MGSERYDVTIVGAGPAGAAAAITLAQRDRNVVLLDRKTYPRTAGALCWLNARTMPLLSELGVNTKTLAGQAVKDVTFVNADFSKTARSHFDVPLAYLMDGSELDNCLVPAAAKAGAKVMAGCEAENVVLRESTVVVEHSRGDAVESKLLLLASGRNSPLIERVGFPRQQTAAAMWTAQVEAALPNETKDRVQRIVVVLGLDGGGSFGLICTANDRVSVSVNWAGQAGDAVPALAQLCRSAADSGVAPLDLSKDAAKVRALPSPASAAIDMESHVGKHTLLIGDAGGFVAAMSNEGIYPAIWSARIAAEVADFALKSEHSQDELMTFDSKWRMQMADYLRAPNTDNQFLIPLVFTNQPLADKMGSAFFCGENI